MCYEEERIFIKRLKSVNDINISSIIKNGKIVIDNQLVSKDILIEDNKIIC